MVGGGGVTGRRGADLHDVRRPLSDSVGGVRDLREPRPDEKRSQSDVGEREERVKRFTVSW